MYGNVPSPTTECPQISLLILCVAQSTQSLPLARHSLQPLQPTLCILTLTRADPHSTRRWVQSAGLCRYMFTVPTAPLSSRPKPKYWWAGKAFLSHGRVLLSPAPSHGILTCRATVKWLVLVSRTMLVFMADWMPQRHCR